ncbi:response regulator transcription factor [Streptomyces sp. NPDC059786]|uniref:response regulator n=1 Tax=Streptomyces sp. NPDC059786 TaxID=3346946 RepID=UPI0036557E30
MTVRVVLADDQPLVRSGLWVIMADHPDLEVVGEGATGAEAVQLVRHVSPDVVVLDIRMPGMDGIGATRLITIGPATTRVLVLTTFDEDDHVYGALRAGASGFVVKDMALDDILAAIRVVAVGDALIAPGVPRRLIADFIGRSAAATARSIRPIEGITAREREVLTLVGRGIPSKIEKWDATQAAANLRELPSRLRRGGCPQTTPQGLTARSPVSPGKVMSHPS